MPQNPHDQVFDLELQIVGYIWACFEQLTTVVQWFYQFQNSCTTDKKHPLPGCDTRYLGLIWVDTMGLSVHS